MNFASSRRIDDKLTGALLAVLSTLLVTASVRTFCAPLRGPAAQVATHQVPAAMPGQAVLVASVR